MSDATEPNRLLAIALTSCPTCNAEPGEECDMTVGTRKVDLEFIDESSYPSHTTRINVWLMRIGKPTYAVVHNIVIRRWWQDYK